MSRMTRWCFPATLTLAGLFALVALAGLWLSPTVAPGDGLLLALLADPALRKTLAISALGLGLTALLFFRKPPARPIRFARTLDV